MKCSAFNHTGSLFAVSGTDGLVRVFSTIALEDSKITEEEGEKEKGDDATIEENIEKGKLDEDEEEIDILDVVMPRPFVASEKKEEKGKDSIPVRRVSIYTEPPHNREELSIPGSPRYVGPSSNIITSPINIIESPKISTSLIQPCEQSSSLNVDTADVGSPGSEDTDTYSVGSNFSFNSMSPPFTGQQSKVLSQNVANSPVRTPVGSPAHSPVRSQRSNIIHSRTQQIEEQKNQMRVSEEEKVEIVGPANPVPNPKVGQKDKKNNKKNDVSKLFGYIHIADLDGHTRTVNSLEFAHGDNRLLSGSDDGTARIWRYDYFKRQWTSVTLSIAVDASDSDQRVTAMRWSVDDALVILGDNKGKIRVFNSQNGELKIEIHAHSNDLYVLDIHPHDWRTIMSAGYDGKISMWDIQDGRNVKS
jgi:WD40 repeat protein